MELIYGKHSVRAVLLQRPQAVRELVIAGEASYHREILDLAGASNITPEHLDWKPFKKRGSFERDTKHQGVFVRTTDRPIYTEGDLDRLMQARCVIALDQVSDPQNLATILRGAAFFGADAVMILKNRSVRVTPVVTRNAVGGAEYVDIYRVTNLARALVDLQQMSFTVYGLDDRAEASLAAAGVAAQTAFVIGAEGEGLRAKTRRTCNAIVNIPGGVEGVESLNAGIAANMALYEYFRTG